MTAVGVPVAFVLFVWWFSTGAILLLVGLPARGRAWSFAAVSAVATAGLIGLAASRDLATVAGAFCAFTSALMVWAWHEAGFLLGFVTGSRKTACPPGAKGRARFVSAFRAVDHHELAIAATVLAIAAITWGQPNQVGLWTFLVLWLMRLSAKLNIFLGVAKLAEEFLPDHLAYLKSYFRRAPANWLLPVSIVVPSLVVAWMARAAAAPGATAFDVAGLTLVASLLALAVIEHLFFILPVPDTALWRWALRPSRQEAAPGTPSGRRAAPSRRPPGGRLARRVIAIEPLATTPDRRRIP